MNAKILLIAVGIIVILAYFYLDSPDSFFVKFVDELSPVNWEEVSERNIIKNSIPISLLEKINGNCKVKAENFNLIIDHEYFIRSEQLAKQLQYDPDEETLVIPCDDLEGQKSRLNVWYATEEAKKYPTKYEHFVTPWNETGSEK